MLVKVDSRSLPPSPDGSIGRFKLENLIFNQPDLLYIRKSSFFVKTSGLPFFFVQFVKIQQDFFEIWPNLFKIRRDLARSHQI